MSSPGATARQADLLWRNATALAQQSRGALTVTPLNQQDTGVKSLVSAPFVGGIVALLAVGCSKPAGGGAPSGAGVDGAPAPAAASPASVVDARATDPGPDAADEPTPAGASIDAPAWPAAQKHVTLTWIVPPSTPHPQHPKNEGLVRRDVRLAVRIGAVERRVSLGALQHGQVFPKHQPACDKLLRSKGDRSGREFREPGDLAVAAFGLRGDSGYAVRRDGPSAIVVVAYSIDDGNCPNDKGEARPCARQAMPIARVPIPEGAAFDEAIVSADAAGTLGPFRCDKPVP